MRPSEPSEWSEEAWTKSISHYRYPSVRLVRTNENAVLDLGRLKLIPDEIDAKHPTSLETEAFHRNLLLSDDQEERLHGLLSVVYWGYYASADGRRVGYALSRTQKVANNFDHAGDSTAEAARAIQDGELGRALIAYLRIHGIGPSFASKMVAFASPETAGVLDSVLCRALKEWGILSEIGENFLRPGISANRRTCVYERWCKYCLDIASRLNGDALVWMDHRDRKRNWRAVDIERAIFFRAGDKYEHSV